jgi:biopolymer transport protein ExbD
MGRIKPPSDEQYVKMDMTPMIDCIFQLIIFFMCSIHFKSLEGKLYSYLPKDKGMAQTEVTDPVLDEVRISLNFNTNKDLYTEIKIGQQVIPDWAALQSEIAAQWTRQMNSGSKPIPFKIDSQPKVPVQAVINALNICKIVGVATVEFAAKTTAPGGGPKN